MKTQANPIINNKPKIEVLLLQASTAGLSSDLWKTIEESFFSPLMTESPVELSGSYRKINSQIGSLAVEAGYYELGLVIGGLSPLEKARALFFAKRKPELTEFISSINPESNELQDLAVLMMSRKWKNQIAQAAEIYEEKIEPQFINISKAQTQAPQVDDSKTSFICNFNLADIQNQAASIYFGLGRYRRATDLYQIAYHVYLQHRRSGSAAIAAYNAWMACDQLGSRSEVSLWKNRCHQILKDFELPSLQLTVRVSELQQAYVEGSFSAIFDSAPQIMNHPSASAVQKLIAMQTLASALTATGDIASASELAIKARDHMSSNKFYTFQRQQTVIEQEILYFSSAAAKNSDFSIVNGEPRAAYRNSVLRARLAFDHGDFDVFENLYREIEENTLTNSPHWLREDLEILRTQQKLNQLSAFQFDGLIRRAWADGSFKDILNAQLNENDVQRSEPKLGVIQNIIKEDYTEALSVCKKHKLGFYRKTILVLQLLKATSDSTSQASLPQITKDLLATVNSHELTVLFQSRILDPNFVRRLTSFSGLSTFGDLRHIDKKSVCIMVDEQSISLPGQTISLSRSMIVFDLLLELFFAGSTGLGKEELVLKVWKRAYDPLSDDSVLYANLTRIRRDFQNCIEVENNDGKYRLRQLVPIYLVRRTSDQQRLTVRQQLIIDLCKKFDHGVNRTTVCQQLNCSERTVLREFTDLVSRGLLQRSGVGRATVYSLPSNVKETSWRIA